MPKIQFENEGITTIKHEDYPELKTLGTPVIQLYYWDGKNYLPPEHLPFIAISVDPAEIIIDHGQKSTGFVQID
jgi:hypothetical protein